MEEKDKVAYEQLLQGIQFYVNKCLVESNRDITTTGKIVGIENDEYIVEVGNVQYSGINTIGGTCTVNEIVKVMIPQGQYNNMFILKGGESNNGSSTVSGVSSVNGKTGTVTLNANDVGALPSSQYKSKIDLWDLMVNADGSLILQYNGG